MGALLCFGSREIGLTSWLYYMDISLIMGIVDHDMIIMIIITRTVGHIFTEQYQV
jgi:hypothetical protein